MPLDSQILVIPTEGLFELIGGHFQGFKKLDPSLLEILEKDSQWMVRADAEIDPEFKQFIGYAMIVNEKDEIFVYQRAAKAADYNETRLYGKWSIGIGGHVELGDEEGSKIYSSVKREIEEEVEIDGEIRSIQLLGGINDDSDEVGRVHFGLWLQVTISGTVKPKGREFAQGEMKSREEVADIFKANDAESWSRICLENMGQ